MTVLTVENVTKKRGERIVINNLSLEIVAGERVALLGHNGAGKTTLLRMALGLTRIDSGRIRVAGFAPGSMSALRATSFLPENIAFHGALTGREYLRHFARLRDEPSECADRLLEKVGLGADAARRVSTYSKGMCQKLGLAQSLLGNPQLMLLDEPTSGLDPVARRQFYETIDAIAADGVAVVVSSHVLTELEARTDRIAILRSGNLVAMGSLNSLRQSARLPARMRITAKPDKINAIADNIKADRINGRIVELLFEPNDKMNQLMRLGELRELIEDVEISLPSLDNLYHYFSTGERERP